MDEHINIVRYENIGKSEAWITRHHIDSFAVWLRRKLIGDSTIDVQLQWLTRGPSATIMQYQGYEINGYTFYTRAQDEKSTNQNSGVRIDAKGHDGNKDSYFGVIEEIWELDYGPLKIPLFRCKWVNRTGGGVTIDRYGMMLGSLDRSQDRENTLRTKVKTLEHELHNRNCTIARTKYSNPYNVGWEGVFIPPTLLHLSRNAPPVPTKVKRLQQGYLIISLGWIVRLGYSHPDHVFFAPREPSVAVLDKLCVTPGL